MMRMTVPTPGTNELTKRLIAQGVRVDDMSTWPEGVWLGDGDNFCYSREWKFVPTWESPCGLLLRTHGDMWGETWANGEFKCAENDNPLFRCPVPGKPCEHRLKLPAGINCQFHRTDREWNEAESVEALRRKRDASARRLWEEDYRQYAGWDGVCGNITIEDMQDGSVRRIAQYNVEQCIRVRCQSKQCPCRDGADRDTAKANIFYDLYVERRYTEGFIPMVDNSLTKGLRVFDWAVARTDAEIALKMWEHDPDAPGVPSALRRKLNAYTRADSKETFFVRHHRYWDGHTDVEMIVEIRNVRVAKNEVRDMMQDLRDVQAGIAVEHDSDNQKAAKAKKTQRRREGKVKKLAQMYANSMERGMRLGMAMLGVKDEETMVAVRKEAARIAEKRNKAREMQATKAAQMTIDDLEVLE